jgi:hypothetical protein
MGIGISDSNACMQLDEDRFAPVEISPKTAAALDELMMNKGLKELAHQLQLDRVASAVDKFVSLQPSLADYKDLRHQLDVWTPSTDDPNQAI